MIHLDLKSSEHTVGNDCSMLTAQSGSRGFRFDAGHIERCRKFVAGMTRERYCRLIAHLDPDSISAVSRIVGRMQLIARQTLPQGQNYGYADIFTHREAVAIEDLNKEFFQQIVSLNDTGGGHIYAWRHYIMPRCHFEAPVLYYEHQLDTLRHPERIAALDFIDVGANDGDSALVFCNYTAGRIYSFEPVAECYAALLSTIALNDCKRVIPVNKALGAQDGEAVIKVGDIVSTLQHSHYLWSQDDVPTQNISITTLDRFAQEHQDMHVGLIKVDIEGLEQDFLRGAEQTIRRFKPTLLISIYHNVDDFCDIKPMLEGWGLGYRFTVSQPVFGHPYVDTLLICEMP